MSYGISVAVLGNSSAESENSNIDPYQIYSIISQLASGTASCFNSKPKVDKISFDFFDLSAGNQKIPKRLRLYDIVVVISTFDIELDWVKYCQYARDISVCSNYVFWIVCNTTQVDAEKTYIMAEYLPEPVITSLGRKLVSAYLIDSSWPDNIIHDRLEMVKIDLTNFQRSISQKRIFQNLIHSISTQKQLMTDLHTKTIDHIRELSARIDKEYRSRSLVKATGSAASLIGTGLLAAGVFSAIILTMGFGIPFIFLGGTLAASGGAVTCGAIFGGQTDVTEELKAAKQDIEEYSKKLKEFNNKYKTIKLLLSSNVVKAQDRNSSSAHDTGGFYNISLASKPENDLFAVRLLTVTAMTETIITLLRQVDEILISPKDIYSFVKHLEEYYAKTSNEASEILKGIANELEENKLPEQLGILESELQNLI